MFGISPPGPKTGAFSFVFAFLKKHSVGSVTKKGENRGKKNCFGPGGKSQTYSFPATLSPGCAMPDLHVSGAITQRWVVYGSRPEFLGWLVDFLEA